MGAFMGVVFMSVGIVVALGALAWHFRARLARFLPRQDPPAPPKP